MLPIPVCLTTAPTKPLCGLCATATGTFLHRPKLLLSLCIEHSSWLFFSSPTLSHTLCQAFLSWENPLVLSDQAKPNRSSMDSICTWLYIWLQQSWVLDYWYIFGYYKTVTLIQAYPGLFLFTLYLEGLEHYSVHYIILCWMIQHLLEAAT